MKFTSKTSTRRSRRKPAKRRLLMENLEHRQLLAVDGFQIDLSGSGTVDLLDPNAGSSIHDLFANGTLTTGSGVTIGTSNVPGQNNENPVAGDDTAAVDEDGPAVTINVADLLSNDNDPDNSGALSVVAVDSSTALGTATLDTGAGTISYDPSGAFESVAQGQTVVDVFQYTVDDSANGRGTGNVSVTITGANDAPTVTGTAIVDVDEGTTATNSGTYADVDDGAVVTLIASEGDLVDNNDGTWSWSMPTTDGDDLNRTITITATDEHSAATTFDFTLNVNNVAPIIALTGDDSVDEAATYELTLGAVTDPGVETISEYEVDWGDGTTPETFADNSAPLKSHIYADGPNDFTITVSITDEDGKHTAATKTITVNNVAPTAGADDATVTVNEGETASTTGTYGDVGDDTVLLSASFGDVIDNNDGTWSWSYVTTDGPAESQTVIITATDSDGAATPTTFELVVNNLAPVVAVTDAVVTVDEGTTASNTGTYSDASGDTVTVTANLGTIVDNDNGTWSWSFDSTDGPDDSQTVTITATDQDGAMATDSFTLVVDNVAPVAAPQAISVLGNVPITRDWSTLLVGATDAGDDVLSVQSIDSTTGDGTLTFDNGAETFRYVPDTGFEGTTSFTFTIADSDGATHQETATITIDRSLWVVDNSAPGGGDGSPASPFDSFTPLNDPEGSPDADADGDIIFVVETATDYNVTHSAHNDGGFHLEDNQFLIGSGLPSMTLEAYLASHSVTVPAGSDTLPTTQSPGPTLTNTTGDVVTVANGNTIAGFATDPTASAGIAGENVSGLTVEFVIIITSGGGGDNEGIRLKTVTGTMTFNNLDIGSGDGETNTGTAIQIDGGTADIQFNDVDIDQDGGALLEILNTAASTFTFDENSELTLQGSDEAAVTITGNDGGTVTLNNDGFSADTTAAVTFNITGNTGLTASTPVNDAPVFVLPETSHLTLEDGGPQTITGFATDVTPGPDPTESEQNVTFNILDNDNTALFATLPQFDSQGNLTYTLADGALGTATIEVNLSDDGGTADGGMDTSETQTFTIEVVPVNDAPTFLIASDPASVPEDAGVQTVAGFASSLLAGPADESNQTLQFEITGNTNADLFAAAPTVSPTGDLSYTPADDVTGTATITIVLKDDGETDNGGIDTSASQTFVITVSPPINDAPSFTLANSTATVDEDAGAVTVANFAGELSSGPADEANQTLTFELAGNSNVALFATAPAISSDGTLTFTPADDAHGTATLVVTLQDSGGTDNGGVNLSTSQTMTITVNPINDEPILDAVANVTGDELQPITFTATANDVDNTTGELTFSLVDAVQTGAILSEQGAFSWTPTEAHGPDVYSFEIIVSDGELEDRQSFTVTVNEVNVAPVLAAIGDHNIDEGNELSFTATATDDDFPANDLAFSLGGDVPAGATITSSGEFAWTPSESQGPGAFTFDVIVSDNNESASETITVTVADINNDPVLASIGDQSGSEHELLTFTATATDTDLPQDMLTFELAGNVPVGASITDGGLFSWTPNEDQGGETFTFSIGVNDGTEDSYEEITWSVAETNDPPTLDAIADQTIDEYETLVLSFVEGDPDRPVQSLVYSLGSNVPDGVTVSHDGELTWTPTVEQIGTHTIEVIVTDDAASLLSVSQSFTVTVEEVADTTEIELELAQVSTAAGSTVEILVDFTTSDPRVNENTILLFAAPDEPGNFQPLQGGPSSGYEDITQDPGESVTEFLDALSGAWQFRVDFDGNGFDAEADEEVAITLDVENAVLVLPVAPQLADPPLTLDGTTATVTWSGVDATNTDFVIATLETENGTELFDDDLAVSATSFQTQNTPNENLKGAVGAVHGVEDLAEVTGNAATTEIKLWLGNYSAFTHGANLPPVLNAIDPPSPTEHVNLAFTVGAIDPESDAISFTLSGAPDGATITPSGQFSWTPDESQGGQTFTFDIIVSDSLGDDSETVTWTVGETNTAPVIDPISNLTVDEGQMITFEVTATDADSPNNDVTLSVIGRTGGNWIIDGGSFSWTPGFDDAGTYIFDITATDNGSPAMSDTSVLTITVNDAPEPTTQTLLDDGFSSDSGGTPAGWTVVDSDGSAAESGTSLTLTGGAGVDEWVALASDQTVNIHDGVVTYTASLASMSAGSEFFFALIDLNSNEGIGIDFAADGGLEIGVPDGDPLHTGLQLAGYQPDQPVELSFTIEPEGIRVTAVQDTNSLDSGLIPNSQLNGFDPALLADALQPILAAGGQTTTVVVDSVSIVSEPLPPFDDYEVNVDFVQGTFEGEQRMLGTIDVMIGAGNVSEATKIQMRLPGDAAFEDLEGGAYGFADAEWKAGENESLAELFNRFVTDLNGDVDFQVDFDGDGSFDEDFTVTLDFAGVTTSEIPNAPQNVAPVEDTVIASGTRSVTLTWDEVSGADEVFTAVNVFHGEVHDILESCPFVQTDTLLAQTSQTYEDLPTGEPLVAIVGASNDLSDRATGAGSVGIFFNHANTSNFTITSTTVSVPAGDSTGSYAGGENAVGGVAFDFEGVASPSEFVAEYHATDFFDAWSHLFGGEDRVDAIWQDFETTSEGVMQIWDVNLTDALGDVTFDDVELTFRYDESLLGTSWKSAADVEAGLQVYHWNGSGWEQQQLIQRDIVNNTITIAADSFSAFVLGGPAIGAAIATSYDSELVVGLGEYREGDGEAKQLAFFEMTLEGTDVPLNANSQTYIRLPGTSDYVVAEREYHQWGHDLNASTPMFQYADYVLDIEQDSLSDSDFHDSLRGSWTVYVDIDGDFNPALPVEESSDAKFTFVWDSSDLSVLPPSPTITSPADEATVDGSGGVTFTWNVDAGSMTGVETEIQVFSDNDNLYYEEDDFTISGQTAISPALPDGKTLEAEVLHIDGNQNFASDAQHASGFASLDLSSTESLFAVWHNIEFTTGTETVAPADITVQMELAQMNAPGESPQLMFILDLEVDDDRANSSTKLLFEAPDEPGFNQLNGGPFSGWEDIEQEDDETAAEFLNLFSDEWTFRIDFAGDGFDTAQGDEERVIDVDVTNALASLPAVPQITNPTAGVDLAVSGGSSTITWTGVDLSQTDVLFVGVDEVGGGELIDVDLAPSATSLSVPNVQAGSTLEGWVGAIDVTDNQFFNHVGDASDFAVEFWLGNYGTFTTDVAATSEAFSDYEVELAYIEGTFDGQARRIGQLDVSTDSDNAMESSKVQIRYAGESLFVDLDNEGYGDAAADILPNAGESAEAFLTRYINLFHGDVDFRVDFEGDGTFDEEFTVSFDLDEVTIADLPAAPQNLMPTEDTTISAGTRSVTLTWDQVTGADGVFAEINVFHGDGQDILDSCPFVSEDVALDATSQTYDNLPTNTDLLAIVGAGRDRSDLASGAGSISVGFRNMTSSNFTIQSDPVSVAAGNSQGSFAGGPGTIGGVGFDFQGVASSAGFVGEYFAPTEYDAWEHLLGGAEQIDSVWQDFEIPSEGVMQIWDTRLTDATGDVSFSSAELTFHYDESLLGTSWKPAAEVEAGLHIYQWDGSEWQQQTLVSRDATNNTITIQTNSLSPLVLGGPEIIPPDYDAELVVGLAQYREGDSAEKQVAFVELEVSGPQTPMTANSAIYVKIPGATAYQMGYGSLYANDHDHNPATSSIPHAAYDFDVDQGESTVAEFHDSLRGLWTVYIDLDGDFDPASPSEEISDVKFSFVWNSDDLTGLPPAPTITSPVDDSTLHGGDGVTLEWEVAAGSMSGVDVEVEVFSDDANFNHDQSVDSGQSATTPSLLGGVTFEAEVIHVAQNQTFAGDAHIANGFYWLNLEPTESLLAVWHNVEFATSMVAVDFSLNQGDLGDGDFFGLDIQIETLDHRAQYGTVLEVTTPLDSAPRVLNQGGGYEWIGLEPTETETFADFIASIGGDYVIDIDFDGDESFDETFTIQLDSSTIVEGMFPTTLVPTSPLDGDALSANHRELEIDLPGPGTADEVFVEVGNNALDVYFFETSVDEAASVTTPALPSGLALDIITAPVNYHPNLIAQTEGSGQASVRLALATLAATSVDLNDHVKAITPAAPSGSYAGGSDAIGGVDFIVDGLTGPANFKAEYQVFENAEWQYIAYGDHDVTMDLRNSVSQPSGFETVQSWEFKIEDSSGNPVAFDHADLTLNYDPELLGDGWNSLSDIENHLVAYQYNGTSWQALETLARRSWDSEIDVRATMAGSHIVLGFDTSTQPVNWQPSHLAGEAEMEVYRVEVDGGDDFYINNVEFSAYGPNITQASTIQVTRPDNTVETFNEEAAYIFLSDTFTNLADLKAARNGTYTVDVDYEDDGTPDRQFTVTFDINDLVDASLPDAPVITSPASGATISAADPNLDVSWQPQLTADAIFSFVHIENGPGVGDNEDVAEVELSETDTDTTFENVPTNEQLMVALGAIETHHERGSFTSDSGTIETRVELVTITTLNVGSSHLQAATLAPDDVCHAVLTTDQLAPIVEEAIERLAETGISEAEIEQLRSTPIEITDLDDNVLGSTTGDAIQIDVNAANHGWYVDPTPDDDTDDEFEERIDLLTTILHEMNHVLGEAHDDTVDDLMHAILPTGTRRLPDHEETHLHAEITDQIFADLAD